MQKDSIIEHTGIVKSVNDSNVVVGITTHPACSGCLASGICDLSDKKKKEIRAIFNPEVKPGDTVRVIMQRSMGFRALFLAYLLPFLIMMTILIVLTSFSVSEAISGITAFLCLIPYYLVIYLKREMIGRSFSFTIKKTD